MTKYDTNLASEFYVLSMLYRLGLEASLTLGNKKSVDIIIANKDKTLTTIEVKGVAKAYDWPADNIQLTSEDDHFYVLVCFENKISDPYTAPSVWVIPARKVSGFVKNYKTRKVVSRALVKNNGVEYFQAWSLIR